MEKQIKEKIRQANYSIEQGVPSKVVRVKERVLRKVGSGTYNRIKYVLVRADTKRHIGKDDPEKQKRLKEMADKHGS